MPRNLRPSELERKTSFVLSYAENANRDFTQVMARLRSWSVGVGGGAAGPSPKNQVSRPTEAAALSKDEYSVARAELVEQLLVADAALRRVERIRRWVMAPPPPAKPAERGLAKCCNPRGCPDDAWAERAGRCDACYRFRLRTDRDRAAEQDDVV